MSIMLDSKSVKIILEKIKKTPEDKAALEELLKLLKPVIKLTIERFPRHLGDDVEQELMMAVCRKAQYISEQYCKGKIKSVTGYFFTFFRNAATVFLNKELKHETHLVSIDDVKVDRAAKPVNQQRHHVIDTIKEEVLDFIRLRFPKRTDAVRAEKYVDVILNGMRPSFATGNIHRFYGGRQTQAKDAYSVVLQKIRERLEAHWSELFS